MKLANHLDFGKYEAQNMKLQNLAAAPASPTPGQSYYDTTLNQGRIWNGTAWKPLGSEGTVTSVTATAPLTSSGGTTPALSISAATQVEAGSMSAADKTKLDGISSGATANATNAQLRDRATHTGEQAISTVTGLQAALDAVAPSVVVRKYSTNVGDGTATVYVITHNLNTRDITWALYTNSGLFDDVIPDVERTTVNTITLRFAVAPAANAYRVVVHG
jgi:hypothetical protein